MREDRVLVVTAELVEQGVQTLAELSADKLKHNVYPLRQQVVDFCPVAILAWMIIQMIN